MTPSTERFSLTIIIFAVIIAGVIWYGLRPLVASVQNGTKQLQTSYQELNTERQKQSLLTQLASTMNEVTSAESDVNQAIPTTSDSDRLTLILQQLASTNHLTLQNLQVGSQQAATSSNSAGKSGVNLATLPFEIDATGSYTNLQALTYDVENNLRVMSISNYSMKSSVSSTNNLSVTIQGLAYYQNSPATK